MTTFISAPLFSVQSIETAVMDRQLHFFRLLEELAAGRTSSLERWLAFGICIFLSLLTAIICDLIIRKVLKRFAARTSNNYDDAIVDALHLPLVVGLTVTGMYFSAAFLAVGKTVPDWAHRLYMGIIFLLIIRFLLAVVSIVNKAMTETARQNGDIYNGLLLVLITPACRAVILIIGTLFMLDNVFYLNISSLLAGAGIAAMAVAFAAQNTIANIFGAITLILDRPFNIGQRIQVDGKDGIVEAISLRSTRLRALDGTLWNIPNKTMSESPILNLAVRPNFKYVFNIGLSYDHNTAQIKQCLEIIHKILDNRPCFNMEKNPPLIFFADIGDYSLDIQAVCWFQTTDFKQFTGEKEKIFYEIIDALDAAGLKQAYPTQTICLEQADK